MKVTFVYAPATEWLLPVATSFLTQPFNPPYNTVNDNSRLSPASRAVASVAGPLKPYGDGWYVAQSAADDPAAGQGKVGVTRHRFAMDNCHTGYGSRHHVHAVPH